jgi:tetratricopeptide (TPR) repeat protein
MRTLMVLVLTGFVAASAAAQEDGAGTDDVARRAFEAGRVAFAAGDYDVALQRFREAYEMSHRPGLLYNIAQSLDRLRRDEEALATLRQYLEEVPNTRSRSEVEARIRVLERMTEQRREEEARHAREAQERNTEQRQEETPPPPSRPPLHPALAIVAGGLALAGGGLAIWTGLETLSRRDAYMAATAYDVALARYNEGQTFQLVTNVLIISSAALAVGAVVMLFFTDWGGSAPADQASLLPTFALGPDGFTAGALGRF